MGKNMDSKKDTKKKPSKTMKEKKAAKKSKKETKGSWGDDTLSHFLGKSCAAF